MTTTIKQNDLIDSVAAALQFISYYHPVDYIQHLARAYEREQGPAARDAIAQIALDEFALDLKAHEQEEHRHPQVVDPHHQRLGQHQPFAQPHFTGCLHYRFVGGPPLRIAHVQGDHRSNGQHDAAGRFMPEKADERQGGWRVRVRHQSASLR
jgi:hypothetical protein